MKVVAISGWKGSGKDTAADFLVKEFKFTRFGFADILKDMVAEQYNIPRNWLDSVEHKELGILKYPVDPKDKFSEAICNILFKEFRLPARDINPYTSLEEYLDRNENFQLTLNWTPRALAILEGSIKRSVNCQYWVQKVIDNMKTLSTQRLNNAFVISDLRYRSEVEQLKDAIGSNLTTIRINRFNFSPSNDASERDLDNYKFDHVINNTGSIEDLQNKLIEIMIDV